MRQTGFSLFPFLSVQLGTMGVLSFLAIVLALLQTPGALPAKVETEVQLVGAPPYVRPLLIECRKNGLWLHTKQGIPNRQFSLADLEREFTILNNLTEEVLKTLSLNAPREQVWLALKRLIPQHPSLKDSFITWLHEIEISNLKGESHSLRIQKYPILLVRTDGLDSYELATQLIEQSSRLAIGIEPLPTGWKIQPYPNLPSESLAPPT